MSKNSNLLSHPPLNHPIGQPFVVLPKVDSTNNYAMAQVHAGMAFHGAAYFTFEQTAGKGQRGKSWLTTVGENIMMSIVLQPDKFFAGKPFLLSALVAHTCYQFIKNYAGDSASVKWPNDLYWNDRKAGGLLIENVFRGANWPYAIAGIGINVNQTSFDPGAKNPVSLRQITGREFNVVELAKELCGRLQEGYQAALQRHPSDILDNYMEVLYKRNECVRLKKDNAIFETTILGVSQEGKLLTRDTMDREFSSGEVEWIV